MDPKVAQVVLRWFILVVLAVGLFGAALVISVGQKEHRRSLHQAYVNHTGVRPLPDFLLYRTSNPFAATASVMCCMTAFTSVSVSVLSNDWKTRWNA